MNEKLTFITASAGTGKTYRLVEEVKNAVVEGKARPEAVIATTFTRASANELQERLSSAFHQSGLHDEAARLENDALISTVHGICFRLLNRFAFEAGISPDIRVIDESEAKLLLDRSINEVVDESVRQKIYGLASRLGQRDTFKWEWKWRGAVKALVETARSNDIRFSDLPAMGAASWAEMKAELGEPTSDNLDEALLQKIRAFLEASAGDEAKGTTKCRNLMADIVDRLTTSNFPWSTWEKISSFESLGTDKPGVAYRDHIGDIGSVASRVGSHPRLQADIQDYLALLFDLAEKAGRQFSEAKKKRGAADYADLEKSTLDLLRQNETVREVLANEIDLLLVDEFQDTSPIQLALFAELGQLADRVLWVGDVKQSIYGFRGSDPELVFQAASGAGNRDSLGTSWRSVPDLVTLTNSLFAPAFQENLGIPESETEIDPHRDSAASSPAVEVAEISTGELYKNGNPKPLAAWQKPAVTADAIVDLLNREGETVVDKSSLSENEKIGESRPLTEGDVAVLVRSGKNAGGIGEKLRARGFDVSMSGAGLLSTPEATLALASLRRWIDPTDSLAAAEVVALEGLNSVEEWLDHRLNFLDQLAGSEGYEDTTNPWLVDSSPALTGLHAASVDAGPTANLASPLEAFDAATNAAGVVQIISLWGPGETRATQRLANLEKLRAYVAEYETRAAEAATPATLNGLFSWLADLETAEEDKFPQTTTGDAISVGTYHSAKGLEWPVVFMADLDAPRYSRLFNLRVTQPGHDPKATIDFSAPLAGRELRLWINPFGGRNTVKDDPHPLVEALEQSEIGQHATLSEHNENLRLLYVGFTRARDRLIFFNEPGSTPTWFNTLGDTAVGSLLGNSGEALPVPVSRRVYEYDQESDRAAFDPSGLIEIPRYAESKTERLSGSLTPSSADPVETATVTGVQEFGERLRWTGHPNERDLGDAMHRILAAEILHPDTSVADRDARTLGILTALGLSENLNPADVRATVDRYRAFIVETYSPVEEFVEVPFTVTNAAGQVIQGYIDHLLILPDGRKLIIDHKIFPGKRSDWEAKALGYSGQLAVYASVVGESEGVEDVQTAIHFVTGGALIAVGGN